LLNFVVELETVVELNFSTLGFKLTESFGLQTDLNVCLHLVISVNLKFVSHLDFAASLKVKANLKLVSAFKFNSANFELFLELQFAVSAVSSGSPSTRVAVSLAGLVARIVGLIGVMGIVFVDAILSTSLGSVVVVVNPVLADVSALIAIIALLITLVVGSVGIVASVLVDISTHILVGAITVTSDTTVASLLADIVAVLIAFAAVATIATTRAVASDTTERTGRLSSVAAIAAVARSGTIGSTSTMGTSVYVTLVEGLEAYTALGKADISRVLSVMLGSTSSVVTNLSVELPNSRCTGCVRKDLSSIASISAITAVRLSAI